MKVMKSKSSGSMEFLIHFANDNQIAKEDVVTMTSDGNGNFVTYTLVFYGEVDAEQKKSGFWG